jgi:tRNA 2-selenouridine synthase
MSRLPEIEAEKLLKRPGFTLLDVRAEVEFADGHVPGSVNLPILTNPERHSVGLTYKTEGPDAAVRLGHALVDPHRTERVAGWKQFLAAQPFPVLTCFRGGLRSEITQRWLAEAGLEVPRVHGGYKALRQALFREWSKPLKGYVVAGLTGSDKTGFLRSLRTPRAIDLEGIAVHRGSAFGGLFQPLPQPSQQSFENAVALPFFQRGGGDFLFEDESRLVGRCVIPKLFFEKMQELPRVFLEKTDEERVRHIHDVYVATPLLTLEPAKVMGDLLSALKRLKNRLGGLAAAEVEIEIRAAFASGNHDGWILRLLRDYYDKLYTHAMTRQPHVAAFRGNAAECEEFLRANSGLFT